jgi:hypothetical protein
MEDQTGEHLEHAEHAQHAAHSGNRFVVWVSMTIAVLAVIAAVIGSLESVELANTGAERTSATLLQNQATDQWGFYQSKSLKKNIYEIAAANGGPNAAAFAETAKKNEEEAKPIKDKATELEKQVEEKLQAAERHEVRLHTLTFAATLLHVAIAIATISIITQGARWPWIGSIWLGIFGILAALRAYH